MSTEIEETMRRKLLLTIWTVFSVVFCLTFIGVFVNREPNWAYCTDWATPTLCVDASRYIYPWGQMAISMATILVLALGASALVATWMKKAGPPREDTAGTSN